MAEPLTEELLAELANAPSLQQLVNDGAFVERSLPEYLQALLRERGLIRSEVVRKAQLNPTFGYQVFTGARGAGRNTVLQLCFAMNLSLREANRLLQAAGCNALYPKSRRDAIIIYCLLHQIDLMGANDTLYDFGEDVIC